MRVSRLLAAAAASLAAASLFSIGAGGVAQAQEACAQIRSACFAAGFRQGAVHAGRGIEVDCIDPILQRRPAPRGSVLRLPYVNPQVVAACRNPAAARRASAPHAPSVPHAVGPPMLVASPPTSATAPTNAPALANAAEPANATAPTMAAAPTNAAAAASPTATSAAPPALGSPLAIVGALVALVAVAGAAIFLAMRRRKPAARGMASAPAPAPTPPADKPSTSPTPTLAPPPAAKPDAPPVVAAVASPTAAPPAAPEAAAAAAPEAAAAPSPSRTHDVFISYSSQDKPVADAVCAILEQQRVRCWITPRDVLPGEEWAGAIVRAINSTRVVVLIFSASSNASHQVLREIERAVHAGAAIIPFRIQDTPPSQSLEYFISTPHWLDALTPPLEQHVLRLAESIKSLLAQTPS